MGASGRLGLDMQRRMEVLLRALGAGLQERLEAGVA